MLLCELFLLVPMVQQLLAFTLNINSQWDPDRVIEYIPGKGPIVISVPHGGRRRPANIPDRNARGCEMPDGVSCDWTRICPKTKRCKALLYGDTNTMDIAMHSWRQLRLVGLQPHIIVNHMDRAKMDPNRGGATLSEAVQNDPNANATYQAYHGFIKKAVAAVKKRYGGKGILFDIHGQHHKQNWTEMGYRLTKQQLNDGKYPADQCSIRGLIGRRSLSARQLLIGPNSFGSLLASFGHRVVPSETVPSPGIGGYYRGGFITAAYGSVAGGEFDAIQVEITQAFMYASAAVRKKFGQQLAASIEIFVRENYLREG